MSRVFVSGFGAVSPAGWNLAAFRQAIEAGNPLPIGSARAARLGQAASHAASSAARCAPGVSGASAVAPLQPDHALRRQRRAGSPGRRASEAGRAGKGRPHFLPAIRLRPILLSFLRGSPGRSGHGQPAGVSGNSFCRAGQPRRGAARQRAARGNVHRRSRLLSARPGPRRRLAASGPRGRLPGRRQRGDQLAARRRALAPGTRRHHQRRRRRGGPRRAIRRLSIGVELAADHRGAWFFGAARPDAKPPAPCAPNWAAASPANCFATVWATVRAPTGRSGRLGAAGPDRAWASSAFWAKV